MHSSELNPVSCRTNGPLVLSISTECFSPFIIIVIKTNRVYILTEPVEMCVPDALRFC